MRKSKAADPIVGKHIWRVKCQWTERDFTRMRATENPVWKNLLISTAKADIESAFARTKAFFKSRKRYHNPVISEIEHVGFIDH